jgi:hypothetical protein
MERMPVSPDYHAISSAFAAAVELEPNHPLFRSGEMTEMTGPLTEMTGTGGRPFWCVTV